MRLALLLLPVFGLLLVAKDKDEGPHKEFWEGMQAKREKLAGLHQEFDIVRNTVTVSGEQGSKWQLIVDVSGKKWREASVSGSGRSGRIFDGEVLYVFEEGSDEFEKPKLGKEAPQPAVYRWPELEWSKAKELSRVPCGFPGQDHSCVLWEAPLKKWSKLVSAGKTNHLVEGTLRVLADLDTGMLVSSNIYQLIETPNYRYQTSMRYPLRRMNYKEAVAESVFRLPEGNTKLVKELSEWDDRRIMKVLGGKAAPELVVKDIAGKTIRLEELKGKTVLLDFWTTWCPPCCADAPSLEKLHKRYGEKLTIVGISVSEARAVVEKYLKEHPKSYATVLSTENELPRPYQVGAFPTYLVIDEEGKITSVVSGDQGFSELRRMLKRSGMDVD